ncbi:MAG TPA: protein-glutamate O-methyltransferase CheR [Terriglobales bacterium]|jgi:chemotaxis protein methyltransferase CheR|nr:protein-glutamate O-methyltransferase CheR [Terriglobales bacterium]
MSAAELSLEQYGRLCRLIYDRLGLSFDDKKIHFLGKRVAVRMESLQLEDPSDYLMRLAYRDSSGAEMQALANLITTNETYMFREYEQLEAFGNACLPEVVARKQAQGSRNLRIWSAGCSSGEETYTVAIIVQEVFPAIDDWDMQIVATDIDEQRLAMAVSGIYGERSMKNVPADYLGRHFTPQGADWRVKPRTRSLVTIQSLNLHDRLQMRKMRAFDFIFCRNVLIYFDDASRKAAVDHFYNALNPGGFLFLGHSESVGRISSAFRLRRMGEHLVYMKPD